MLLSHVARITRIERERTKEKKTQKINISKEDTEKEKIYLNKHI